MMHLLLLIALPEPRSFVLPTPYAPVGKITVIKFVPSSHCILLPLVGDTLGAANTILNMVSFK